MLACRNALVDTAVDGTFDVQLALKHLRETQTSKTKTKTEGRAMGEGSVAFTQSAFGEASGLALTCETDFAAKSDTFVKFSRELLNEFPKVVEGSESLSSVKLHSGNSIVESDAKIQKTWDEALATIRENMSVRGAFSVKKEGSYFATYVHNKQISDGYDDGIDVGKVGAVVELTGDVSAEKFEEVRTKPSEELLITLYLLVASLLGSSQVGKRLAMHIVAASPKYLSLDNIPNNIVEEEMNIVKAQMEAADNGKKPPEILEKIAKGKFGKWASGVCLLEQEHVADPAGGGAVKKVLKREGVDCAGFLVL
ncbi:hypothetical protein TL16_g08427 [Triparma laevis f. inornata]|uniref:Elongation factor Ts, mitochondrial n=1 Tax=Triparma laevis f. inornata TaxID=1714386 RepID=A0A9W7B253_9STRA|nr:hypothetical protein TL16_g08427 [Triparma laevis f. inornata]